MAVNDPYYLHQLHDDYYYGCNNEQRNINTLFVSGLPDDVHPREIHNLFRRRRGFDSCQLKFTGRRNQVVAFVTFFNHESAMEALHALNGVKFDPETGSVLHIELARSNSTRKHTLGSGPYVVIDKRKKNQEDAQETSSNDDSKSVAEEDDEHKDPDENVTGFPSGEDDQTKEKSLLICSEETPGNNIAEEPNEKTSEGNGHTCSTLFIANLGPTCTKEELEQVLSQHPGFNTLKLRAKGGMPVAFADFESVKEATSAMVSLQDNTLPSSDRGGMHIEYARSKMRKHEN